MPYDWTFDTLAYVSNYKAVKEDLSGDGWLYLIPHLSILELYKQLSLPRRDFVSREAFCFYLSLIPPYTLKGIARWVATQPVMPEEYWYKEFVCVDLPDIEFQRAKALYVDKYKKTPLMRPSTNSLVYNKHDLAWIFMDKDPEKIFQRIIDYVRWRYEERRKCGKTLLPVDKDDFNIILRYLQQQKQFNSCVRKILQKKSGIKGKEVG